MLLTVSVDNGTVELDRSSESPRNKCLIMSILFVICHSLGYEEQSWYEVVVMCECCNAEYVFRKHIADEWQ